MPTPKGKNLALTTDLRGVPGDVLRAARAALGWTIQKAAKESGVSSVTLSKIESGPPRTTIGPADEPILAAYLRAGVAIYREGSAFWISVRRAE